jgi:transposase
MILPRHRQRFKALLKKQSDMTLAELRDATGLKCSLAAICYVLGDMDLTYKKRLSGRVNRTAVIS